MTTRPAPPLLSRQMLLLALTVFIDLLGFGIILPNLPRYIEEAVGVKHDLAAFTGGLLAASYSFTQFLCAPLWGRWSDRVGRRPVILLSLIGVAAAYTLFGFANGQLWMLFAARLLAGVLSSASIGVAFAYVADITTPENRAKGIGLIGACLGLGFVLGPAFGGVLGHKYIALPAFVAAGMALVNFVFSYFFLPESLTKEEREAQLSERGAGFSLALLSRVAFGPAGFLFALSFLVTFAFSALEQSFSFYLLSAFPEEVTPQNQPLMSGLVLGVAGVAAILIQGGLIGRLVARFGEAALVRWGIALMVVGFALFPLPQTVLWLTAGPMVLLSVGRAMAGPALSALVSKKANLGQGLTLSTSSSYESLARTIGPVVAGSLFRFAPPAPYLVSAVVMAGALALAFATKRRMEQAAPASAPPNAVK